MKTKGGGLSRVDQHIQNAGLQKHGSNIFNLSKLIFTFYIVTNQG
jgi:hypothetical protein